MLTFASALNDLTQAGAFAADADTATKKSVLNEATEMLIESGRWLGTQQHISVSVNSSGVLTLPRHYVTVLGATVDAVAVPLAGKWYTYLQNVSTDIQSCQNNVQDQGDGYCTIDDPSGPCTIKVACGAESGSVHVQGLDQSGNPVYAADGTLGFDVDLNSASWSTTQVSRFTSIQLPVTSGLKTLTVKYEDATTSVLGLFEPGETLPSYRRYLVPEATTKDPDSLEDDDATVVALCQRRFVKLVSDTDLVWPAHTGALKQMCLAVYWSNEADESRSEFHFKKALELLGNNLKRSRPESEIGAVRINCIGGGMGIGIRSTF